MNKGGDKASRRFSPAEPCPGTGGSDRGLPRWRKDKKARPCVGRLLAACCLLLLAGACLPKDIPAPAKPARVALVLGAGSTKGFAHVGVLKVLESHRIPVHLIVGTSAGSFVGSLYASGIDAFRLQALALAIDRDDVVDFTLPDNGFVKGEKLEAYVNRLVKNIPLEKFKIPFYAVATNLQSGEEAVFGVGNAGKAVRASCSIPGVFQPVRIGDRVYVDGGVVSPVAVDVAKRYGADLVLAVDISGGGQKTTPQGTIETILQAVDIMHAKIAATQLQQADVAIRPRVAFFPATDFTRRHEIILEGEKAAMAALPAIQILLQKLRQEGRLP